MQYLLGVKYCGKLLFPTTVATLFYFFGILPILSKPATKIYYMDLLSWRHEVNWPIDTLSATNKMFH